MPETETETETEERQSKGASALSVLLTVLDPERAKAIINHRKRKKSPLDDHTAKLLIKQLEKWPDPTAAADEMLLRGWLSFKPEWMANGHGHGPPARQSAAERKGAESKRVYEEMELEANERDRGSKTA